MPKQDRFAKTLNGITTFGIKPYKFVMLLNSSHQPTEIKAFDCFTWNPRTKTLWLNRALDIYSSGNRIFFKHLSTIDDKLFLALTTEDDIKDTIELIAKTVNLNIKKIKGFDSNQTYVLS
ncbi:MAG: hypothetical protein WCG01_00935 [bacterium]